MFQRAAQSEFGRTAMGYQESGAASVTRSLPSVRAVTPRDLIEVLAKGVEDFRAMPTHIVFLSLIYPVVALVIAWVTFKDNLLPLLYAMVTGLALIGPFAAIGIYGLSRRREEGLDAAWNHAFDLPGAHSLRAILALGLCLLPGRMAE
jgi:uncharacterized membrane protein